MWSEMVEGKLLVPEVHTYLLDWSSHVQLIEASHVKTTCGSELPKRFRFFVFADFQGVKVTALAIDANIARFDGVLVPFRKYCISKALVREIPDHRGIGSYRFYWVLTEGTVIEEVTQAGPPKLPYYFGLRSSKNFHFVANTESFINVMGVVICALPPREVFFSGGPSVARDYVIVDYDLRPIVLTLWNEFESIEGSAIIAAIEQNPIIIGIRLRVTTDNYLSLTTQSSSVILVSPDVHEASRLRAWYHDNASRVARMINARSYLDASVLLPPVSENRVSQISAISHATKFDLGIAWIKGRAYLDHRMGRLWYLACPHCYLPNDFAVNWGIMCRYCSREVYHFPRACVTLMIKDDSGSLTLIATGEEAEKLIGLNAFRLQQVEQEDVNLTDHVESELAGKFLLCCVKHSDDVIVASRSVRYTVVTTYEVGLAESGDGRNV